MSTAVISPPVEKPQAVLVEQGFSRSLQELLEDCIYLLFMLRNGNSPGAPADFGPRVDQALAQFETQARNLGKASAAIEEAKYAFCALMDEIVLASEFEIREQWERAPLQLRLFGEHLAGERFFDKLDLLRLDPVANLEVLEVYYTCLLLGFQGKYLLEGSEKLNYLITRIGQEITHARGKSEFAPHWRLPQRFQQYVRDDLPLWLYFALLALVVTVLFFVYLWLLQGETDTLKEFQARPALSGPLAPGAAEPPRTRI